MLVHISSQGEKIGQETDCLPYVSIRFRNHISERIYILMYSFLSLRFIDEIILYVFLK